MNTTTQITCPACKAVIEIFGEGRVECPSCGQPFEIGTTPDVVHVAEKEEVNNGLGWWTAVTVLAASILIPSIILFIGLVVIIIGEVAFPGTGTNSTDRMGGMALLMMIPAGISIAVGEGLRAWAKSKKFTLVCSECGHDTTKHAKVCAQCKTEFSRPAKKRFGIF